MTIGRRVSSARAGRAAWERPLRRAAPFRQSGAALLALFFLVAPPVRGEPSAPGSAELDALRRMFEAQQGEIERLRARLEAQEAELARLNRELGSTTAATIDAPSIADAGEPPAGSPPVTSTTPDHGPTAGALASGVSSASGAPAPELPTEVVTGDFPGSIRIPGSTSSIRLGGMVRVSAIRTLEPLGSDDRFLTHSIPVGEESAGDAERFRTNVRPSRFHLDVRRPVGEAPLRAFLEGDFASSTGNSFRLRHAYLQWGDLLAGQTWSTFSDPESEPEDLDFEGLNSLNILRQPQLRWSPRLGRARLAIALEDSQASISGAESVNRYPNLVIGRRTRGERGHLFAAVSLRDLRGQTEGSVDSTAGWGVTLAGRRSLPWNRGRDEISFQLTTGEGVATYVADLSSAGGQDAVYDVGAGRIRALPAAAISLGYLHAWPDLGRLRRLRSSLVAGWVAVDNLPAQPGDAYARTLRLSANLVASPATGVDLGFQYIWGQRQNLDGATGSSSQVQLLAQYRF